MWDPELGGPFLRFSYQRVDGSTRDERMPENLIPTLGLGNPNSTIGLCQEGKGPPDALGRRAGVNCF